MENRVQQMSFQELKAVVASLEKNPEVTPETKVFLDTGWDSLQEILPGAIKVATAQGFTVTDSLTNERFPGFALPEKAEKFETQGDLETVIIIENLY